ncbi:MAG: YdbL family protein [Candidatus Binatia bacterium]
MRTSIAFVLMLLSLFVTAAGAADLDELRTRGVVGERFDGLAVVRGDDAAAKKLVGEVNAKRSKIYADRAKAEGAPAAEVGKVYAKEIAGKAPTGTWFLGEDGKWVQKN